MADIGREVLHSQKQTCPNKFISEYDWDKEQFNHDRLGELQQHGEMRWSQGGYIILDVTVTGKSGVEVPGSGHFYDHAEGDII